MLINAFYLFGNKFRIWERRFSHLIDFHNESVGNEVFQIPDSVVPEVLAKQLLKLRLYRPDSFLEISGVDGKKRFVILHDLQLLRLQIPTLHIQFLLISR